MGALIAAGLGAVGNFNAAYDESQAARREALQAEDNKKLAWSAAADAIARGNRLSAETRVKGGELAGAQKVAYANSGVDPNSGTAAKTQATTRALAAEDARTQELNAAAEAWGFRRHGLQYTQQAQLEAARSNARVQGHILGGVGSLAKAGTAISSYWDE